MNAQSRSFLTDNGEWMLNAIKRNPEGLLLLAAGAVLMLRTGARASGAAQLHGCRLWPEVRNILGSRSQDV